MNQAQLTTEIARAVAEKNYHQFLMILFAIMLSTAPQWMPTLLRKLKGRNGTASLHGSLDKLTEKVDEIHDSMIEHNVEIENLKEQINRIDAKI